MVDGFFITGTNTNVGKTLVTACIAWKLKSRGINIGIMKPFATADGIFSEEFYSSDPAIISKTVNIKINQKDVNPFFFNIGCSPYMASKLLKLKAPSIYVAYSKFKNLRKRYDSMVVEGIGGIMVPINRKHNLIDFIKLTNLPVVIVTTPEIGTLNHTLLTIRACNNYNIPIYGIIINKMPRKPSQVERYTPKFLEKLTYVPIIGIIPYFKGLTINKKYLRKISKSINI